MASLSYNIKFKQESKAADPNEVFNLFYLGDNNFKDAKFIGTFTSFDNLIQYTLNDSKNRHCMCCEDDDWYYEDDGCRDHICESIKIMVRSTYINNPNNKITTKYYRITTDNNIYYDKTFCK